jgi:hypothetical protein
LWLLLQLQLQLQLLEMQLAKVQSSRRIFVRVPCMFEFRKLVVIDSLFGSFAD